MIKNHLSNGLTYYRVTVPELRLIGGLGICDDCGATPLEGGYLVPVLNHYQCKRCFEDWSSRAKHYSEDDWFEEIQMKYWEYVIPITPDEEPEELHVWLFNGWDLTDG